MYVPDALREWGETLYEWNTLCESLVVETNHDDGSTSNTLTQDVKRQVPLTACESVEIQFETIGRVSTEDFTCRADSEGNFVLASDQITVDNDTQSARFHACFHVSREKRVRFDILLQKYLTSSGAKHHVNVGKAYLEERIQGPLDEATLDKLYEQGLRETNEIANTTRPSEETALSFGVNPLAEDMETDERHVIGLPMDAWLDIYSSSSDPSHLCIGVNMQGAEGKVFSATMQYSDSVLISTSMS